MTFKTLIFHIVILVPYHIVIQRFKLCYIDFVVDLICYNDTLDHIPSNWIVVVMW
jgi:hypothetical protein